MHTTFINFLADEEAWDMYVTGAAGTGKTTDLANSVQYCIQEEIPYVVCAYTHKACGILRTKLPTGARVQTLHSFLGKRPTINADALKTEHVQSSTKVGATDEDPKILFLDEYSMVGEKDFCDIREAQDSDYDGIPALKVVWIGDCHQLPPVGDIQAINPSGDYCVTLTKQYRNDNPLQIPLNRLISYLNGANPEPLEAVHGYFERDLDIVSSYISCKDDKVILAFTNERVQTLNEEIAGKDEPDQGDLMFSPTTQHQYTFVKWIDYPTYIDMSYTDPLMLGSKYKTLEHLIDSELCRFAEVIDEDGEVKIFAAVFGHYNYKWLNEDLANIAVDTNKAIESKHKGYKASGWSRANSKHKLARQRAKAWRDCLSIKDCVICLDFPYAMTVHKSQGSTYHSVFIDTNDLAIIANRNFNLYLKLTYVAISRASNYVGTN